MNNTPRDTNIKNNEVKPLVIGIFYVLIVFLGFVLLTKYVTFIFGKDITYWQAILVTIWLGIIINGNLIIRTKKEEND